MIVERIKEYLDKNGISVAAFERSIGMSNASFAKSLKNKGAIGTDKLENILSIYKDISPAWLLTGEGSMLKSEQIDNNQAVKTPKIGQGKENKWHINHCVTAQHPQPSSPVPSAIKQPEGSQEGIPLIPLSAMAGAFTSDMPVMEYECERYVIPAFKGADFLISVKGDSMLPTYHSGDMVACQKIPLSDIFFQWNKTYVLDTDQGPLIKRVRQAATTDHVLLVSDNADYAPFELPVTALHAIALVRGIIRLE